jgi:hypothetical protein
MRCAMNPSALVQLRDCYGHTVTPPPAGLSRPAAGVPQPLDRRLRIGHQLAGGGTRCLGTADLHRQPLTQPRTLHTGIHCPPRPRSISRYGVVAVVLHAGPGPARYRDLVGGPYDPDVAALLVLVEAQLQISRAILTSLQRRGVPDIELAGPHAGLDQLQAGIAEARNRLLPDEHPQRTANG